MRGRASTLLDDGIPIAGGTEDFYLINCAVTVDGKHYSDGETVPVDALKEHNVGMWFQIGNRAPYGWTDPWGLWRCCVTVYDETHKKTIGYNEGTPAQGGGTEATYEINVGKITEPTTFRIKVWANQDAAATPPPTTSW